jgi:phosphoglycerol transferase MdoB-like AlkP superfamily enzyme
LKFGDVIIAVASVSVAFLLIDTVLSFALIPMNSAWGGYVADIVSLIVSALIVGYVFAGKIREESKMASIGKVVVLFAFVMMFAVMIWLGSIPHLAWVYTAYGRCD